MRTTLRESRERTGVSMPELARRLGVSVQAVSNLERNDDLGVAKPSTVQRAFAALKLVRVETTIPLEVVEEAERKANEIVEETMWSMALENQMPTPDAVEKIRKTVTLDILQHG